MNTLRILLCSLILAISVACQSAPAESPIGPGRLVYQTMNDAGLPAPELVVMDETARELNRITIPEGLAVPFPTLASNKLLYRMADDELALVDVASGSTQKLSIPTEEGADLILGPSGFQQAIGEQWGVLANPAGAPAYLLNINSGEVTDLFSLLPDESRLFNGRLSPDQQYLAVVGNTTTIIPTANPQDRRTLESAYFFDFSSDSKQFVYLHRGENKHFEIVVEAIDGSNSEVILSSEEVFGTVKMVPGQAALLYAPKGELALFNLSDHSQRKLLDYPGAPYGMWFSHNGDKLVFSYHDDESDQFVYRFIDIASGDVKALDTLDGFRLVHFDPRYRWLLFADDLDIGTGNRFASLDLESGQTHALLQLDGNTRSYPTLRIFSNDGRYSLITTDRTNTKQSRLWLFDAQQGEARVLTETSDTLGAFGRLSPDGNWVLVVALKRVDDATRADMSLMSIDGETTLPLGIGFGAIWTQP